MATVTYNSYPLPNVYGPFVYNENEVEISFSCNFLVTSSSESGLVSACASAEAALTEKNKDLLVSFGGTTELNFSHSGNTGFSSRPHFTKLGNDLATGTSRAYSFSAAIQLPFTQSGYNCRREASFNVSYLPSRQKQVSFQMLYTCSPSSTSALTNYTSYGKTWAASILTGIGGNFELISERLQEEQERKIVNASLVYQEILTNQSTSGIDDTAIVNPQVSYSCSIEQQAGKGITSGLTSNPLVRINITYSTTIDKTVAGTDLNTVYHQRVRPYLIQNAYTVLGLNSFHSAGSYYVVESESKSIDNYNYTISGSLTILALQNGTIFTLTETISISENPNIVYKKIWDGVDHTFSMYSTGKITTLQRMITITKFSSKPDLPKFLTNEFAPPGCKWVKVAPTVSNYRLDLWGVGSGGTQANLKTISVYVGTFSEQYLAVRSANLMRDARYNILE